MYKTLYNGGMYGRYKSIHFACFFAVCMLHKNCLLFLSLHGLSFRTSGLLRRDVGFLG